MSAVCPHGVKGYPFADCDKCFPPQPEPPAPGEGHPAFYAYADELHERHRLKSGGYGTGADPFANFSAIAAVSGRHRWDYPVERIIEKCTRIQSLSAQGRFDELREEFRDIGGLAGCCDAMLEEDHYERPTISRAKVPVVPLPSYLRVDPEIERERRWREGGVGLTD